MLLACPKRVAHTLLNFAAVVANAPSSLVRLGFLDFFEGPCQVDINGETSQLTFYLFISTEFLGFNNKTCDAGVPPMSQTYGNTVGPLIRQASGDSKLWRWWEVKMTSKISSSGAPMATIKNIFPSNKGKPKCLGHYITDYYHYKNKAACTELPWAERVHMHAESRPWEFQAVPGTDCFNIIDDAKPDGCLKFLSASASCSEQYVHLAAGDDGSGLQRWRLVGYKGPPPAPLAKSPPRAKSPPPPSAKPTAPLLISVSASSPTTGSVVFQPTAGASFCNVTISKDGQTVTRTITALNYPFTNFYAAGLASDTDYTVKVLCQLPSGATLPAPVDGTLHTPPNSGHPAVINVVPTSSTSGNITIVAPDAQVCKAKLYEIKATPKAGGATQTFTSSSLTAALTGLTSGVQYSIIVDAICDDGSTTKPSDPIYFTPLKSTTPPPSPPPSPGSKAPPTVKPSPPPPLNVCTAAPTVDITAVTGNLLSFNIGIPKQVQGTTSSQFAYGVGCTYLNGTDAGGVGSLDNKGNSTWLPATIPISQFQLHISKAATCELIVLVQQLGQRVPVLCNITAGSFTIQNQDVTPGISDPTPPTTTSPPKIQIVKPTIGCDNMSYVVSTAAGTVIKTVTPGESAQSVPLPGLPPNSTVTVQGVCPDGSKTPTSAPVTVSTQCINGTSYISTTGLCTVVPPSPPPPSPPPPVLCLSGQYNNGSVCAPCPTITGCHQVTCTSATDSTCVQCDVGYLLQNSTCVVDRCASAPAGAITQVGNLAGFGEFIKFTNANGTIFPPGEYEVRYADGCMKYGGGQSWTVNAEFPNYAWYIGTAANVETAHAPGAVGYTACTPGKTPGLTCGFEDFNECVKYSKNLANVPVVPVTLTSSSELGVWIRDGANGGNQYGDNIAGEGGNNPKWSVKLKGCSN